MTYVHVCDIVLMVTKVNQSIPLKIQLSSNTSVEITHTIVKLCYIRVYVW